VVNTITALAAASIADFSETLAFSKASFAFNNLALAAALATALALASEWRSA
jgi:hypothetical protein